MSKVLVVLEENFHRTRHRQIAKSDVVLVVHRTHVEVYKNRTGPRGQLDPRANIFTNEIEECLKARVQT